MMHHVVRYDSLTWKWRWCIYCSLWNKRGAWQSAATYCDPGWTTTVSCSCRSQMRNSRSQKRTVVRDAQGKHVHLERLDNTADALQPDALQQHLHRLLQRYCEDTEDEEEDENLSWAAASTDLHFPLKLLVTYTSSDRTALCPCSSLEFFFLLLWFVRYWNRIFVL